MCALLHKADGVKDLAALREGGGGCFVTVWKKGWLPREGVEGGMAAS